MKRLIFLIMFTFAGFNAFAQSMGNQQITQKKSKNVKYEVEVKGNCEQCKKRIEKAAYSIGGVKSAVWEANTQRLNLILNEDKSPLSDVEKAVAKAGHDTKNVRSTDEDYNNLHHCCLYERK